MPSVQAGPIVLIFCVSPEDGATVLYRDHTYGSWATACRTIKNDHGSWPGHEPQLTVVETSPTRRDVTVVQGNRTAKYLLLDVQPLLVDIVAYDRQKEAAND